MIAPTDTLFILPDKLEFDVITRLVNPRFRKKILLTNQEEWVSNFRFYKSARKSRPT